jgi:hypothetical protein
VCVKSAESKEDQKEERRRKEQTESRDVQRCSTGRYGEEGIEKLRTDGKKEEEKETRGERMNLTYSNTRSGVRRMRKNRMRMRMEEAIHRLLLLLFAFESLLSNDPLFASPLTR